VVPAPTIGDLLHAILDGGTALLVEGAGTGLAVYLPQSEGRAVQEPAAEPVIRGPREGFTEHLSDNTAMLRRRLRSPQLRIESLRIGRSSWTAVVMIYLRDVADPGVVAEVRRRLEDVEIDSLEDSSYLEELIEDDPYSLFPTILNTERPDAVAASLSEGRVAILTDNSPSALIVPVSLWSFLQASEDHYQRYPIATFLRLLRLGLAAVSLLGPAIWVAVLSYHQEMLPSALLLTVAATREGIPFPAIVEALLMEIFFEALREAGVRLPRPIGQAVSIVGALVIGQAAVQAGIVSAPKVIVVAATGIASFTIPRFTLGIALRLLRFGMMLLAGTLGLFGLMLGLIMLLYHLCALRSFGVPYLSPVAPLSLTGLKDSLIRGPRWLLDQRPKFLGSMLRRRMARHQRPAPPSGTSGGRSQ
jgi:spore germination protein KA